MKHRGCADISAAERMNDLDAASMRGLCDEHGAALCRHAVRLTGDRARAEDVAQVTLLRAWPHPEEFKHSERSVRAWPFADVRNMIIDERRSLRFRHEACELDGSGTPDHAGVDEVNVVGPAADPRCAGEALAAKPRRDGALVFPEWTTAQIADDRRIPEGTVKSRLHYALRARRLTLQEIGVRHDAEVVTAPRLDTGRGFRQAALRMRK